VWYAVTNSKTGYHEIFPNWPAAQIHVVNISGASVRKFCTYGEAQEYMDGHKTVWNQKAAVLPIPHVPFSGYQPEASQFNPKSAQPNTGSNHSGNDGGILTLYPPGMLMGEDPSTGKTDEVFKIDIKASEEELQDALCPPDLSEAMAKSLMNGTIDSVALPGGLNSGGEVEGTSSDVGMLDEALEELVTQNRGLAGKSGRSDLCWCSKKRTSIRSITIVKRSFGLVSST
jgi:hypothetical protein